MDTVNTEQLQQLAKWWAEKWLPGFKAAVEGAMQALRDLEPLFRELSMAQRNFARRSVKARERSLRNQPPFTGRWAFQHPSTHNRKRNKHGRAGIGQGER